MPPIICTSKCRKPEHPLGRLAHHGEGLFQQVVEALSGFQPGAEFRGLPPQGRIVEGGEGGFEGGDAGDTAPVTLSGHDRYWYRILRGQDLQTFLGGRGEAEKGAAPVP